MVDISNSTREQYLRVLADFISSDSYYEYLFSKKPEQTISDSPLLQDALSIWKDFNVTKYWCYTLLMYNNNKELISDIVDQDNISLMLSHTQEFDNEIFDLLRVPHRREIRVLLARTIDFGEQKLPYYYDHSELAFSTWSNCIFSIVRKAWASDNKSLKNEYLKCIKSVLGNEVFDIIFDDLWKRWRHQKSSIDNPFQKIGSAFDTALPKTVIGVLSKASELNSRELVKQFLDSAYINYDCEIIDALEYNEEDMILESLFVKWDAVDDENKSWPKDKYFYGEGITGSTLELKKNVAHRYIGTNWVQHDARTSKNHIKSHERSHGIKLRNYWCFPIFIQDSIAYIVRIVNKKSGFWGYDELDVFDYEIRCLEESLHLASKTNLPFRESALSISLWSLVMQLLEMESNDDYFVTTIFNTIHYLMRIVNCNVEGEAISISIGLTRSPYKGKDYAISGLNNIVMPKNLSVLNKETPDQKKSICIYDSDSIIHVYDYSGKFVHVQSLAKDESPLKVCELLSRSNVNMVFQARKTGFIRYFRDGELLGDMYVSETTGFWKLRRKKDYLERVFNSINNLIERDMLVYIFNLLFEVSEKSKGAILISGKKLDDFVDDSVKQSFRYIDDHYDLILPCCSVDGAMIIDRDGLLLNFGKQLKNSGVGENKNYGARHNAALIASLGGNTVSFAVSENGGISCFYDGVSLIYKDEIMN